MTENIESPVEVKDPKSSIVIKVTPEVHQALAIARIKRRKASIGDLVVEILKGAEPSLFE